jgi:hypothetical protein
MCISTTLASEKSKKFEEQFAHVPLPELPSRAAEIIRLTPAADRSESAVLIVQTIVQKHPAAAASVVAAVLKAAPEASDVIAAAAETSRPVHALAGKGNSDEKGKEKDKDKGNGNGKGNSGGNGNGNAGGNGDGVGHGPGENKPGKVIVKPPPNPTLPNGKPRHFPPEPPHRPVDPPRPVHYNRPGHN